MNGNLMETTTRTWLQMQCMMISEVMQGLVLHIDSNNSTDKSSSPPSSITANWPPQETPAPGMTQAAEQVLVQQESLLTQTAPNEILLAQPIVVADQFWGVIVLRMASRPENDLQATQQLLQWGGVWLQLLLKQNASASYNTQYNKSQSAHHLQLLLKILAPQSLAQSASVLVNELASLLGSNRVSLGLCQGLSQGPSQGQSKGKALKLFAVSNNATFDQRTQAMQQIIQAMEEAAGQRQDLEYSADDDPPSSDQTTDSAGVLRNHQRLQETNHGAVYTWLLRHDQQVIGALTIEANPHKPLQSEEENQIKQLIVLVSPIFELKLQAQSGLWQHGRRQLKQYQQYWFKGRQAKGKYLVAGLALFIALLFVPADHKVTAEATLESTVKRVITAPQDGYLLAAVARPGTEVKRGETLAQLDNRELILEQRKWSGQLRQYRQEYDNALANYDRAQASILVTQVEQARIQLQLIAEKLKRTKLTAPIGGLIVSEDISQSLGAPVKQGQVLFEVAPLNRYRVQLLVDERNIRDLQLQQSGRLILSSLPGQTFAFTINKLLPLTEVRDGNNYFRVEAQLDQPSTLIRPGMTGSGKILVGTRSLGWLWFHDIIDWLRLKLWI